MADQPSLIDVAAPLWSAERVRRALALDHAALIDWTRNRRLLGLPASDDAALFYPLAQFETIGGRTRVKPALAAFLQATARLDPWTVAVVLQTPAPELDGLTPGQWVDEHRGEDNLIDLAQTITLEADR